MNRMKTALGCLAMAVFFTGCATQPQDAKPLAIGKAITFTTKEPAPAEFDSWTFHWSYPAVERFDADLRYTVFLPDGNTYLHDCGVVSGGGGVRSDFWPTMFTEFNKPHRDLITPFHGKNITITVQATKGRIRFVDPKDFHFVFYKKGADGKIDWEKPFKKIDSVMTL